MFSVYMSKREWGCKIFLGFWKLFLEQHCLARNLLLSIRPGNYVQTNTCWLLTPQVPSEVCKTSEGVLIQDS